VETEEFTLEEFQARAARLNLTNPKMLEELYPLVKDLIKMSRRVNKLATELHKEIDVATLSKTATGE
jgi:hypothetical protein